MSAGRLNLFWVFLSFLPEVKSFFLFFYTWVNVFDNDYVCLMFLLVNILSDRSPNLKNFYRVLTLWTFEKWYWLWCKATCGEVVSSCYDSSTVYYPYRTQAITIIRMPHSLLGYQWTDDTRHRKVMHSIFPWFFILVPPPSKSIIF